MANYRGYPTKAHLHDQGRKDTRDGNSRALECHENMSRVPCGLVNLGTTCYLNVILQMLFMTVKCRDLVLSLGKDVNAMYPDEKLLKALADLFWNLKEKTAYVHNTKEITQALNIRNVYEQQDAAEYLQMMLHRMTYLSEMFTGNMVTSTTCSRCHGNNDDCKDFLSIPLSVDDKGPCEVDKVLTEYLEIHKMNGDDKLYCNKCGSMSDMETKNDIKKWPDILTLQLKRFDMTQFQTYRNNDRNVQITSTIQRESVKYELYVVINHHGTYSGGHYDALIKDESGNWYHFNDQTVTKVNYKDGQWINSRSAYLLMYRKGEHCSRQPFTCKETSTVKNEENNSHRPQVYDNKDRGQNYQKPNVLKNTAQEDTRTKIKQSMKSPKSSTENQSSVSEFSSKMLKQSLKEEFQYLNKEKSPGERQILNEIFIECEIIEEHDSHSSDKREIMRRNIFTIRTVLMKGEAGIGKTATVQKFILDWAEEKSNHDIEYIFLIPFHKLNIIRETVKECSFMELLQRCCENTEHLNPESRIMLILDGLNEFKVPLDFQTTKKIEDPIKPASVSDLLTNLMMGNLLPNAQIWITSRPAAANQIPVRFIDRVTEIQGFNDKQKVEYFRKSISDPIMANKVISLIQKSPRINSMCHLPDYCLIIAAIPENIISTGGSDFPKNLTQMYSKLLLAQTDPVPERRETIIALGKIAFDLMLNGKSFFGEEELKKSGRDKSVLENSSIIKVIEIKTKHKFCFVNQRTQDFLAALYVTSVINGGNHQYHKNLSSLKLELGEQSLTAYCSFQKVVENILQRKLDLFFCFFLGLKLESSQRALKDPQKRKSSSSSSQEIIKHIKTMIMNSSSDDADKCSLLLDCLKELDERYLIQEIKKQLKSGLRLSPAQFPALMFVLLNSEEKLDAFKSHRSDELPLILRPETSGELQASQCGLGDRSCSALRSNPYHLRELDLSEYVLGGSGIKQLSDLLAHPQCELEKLGLRSCQISDGGCADLSSALRSNPSHLRELDLSGNTLGGLAVKQLSALLASSRCKLEKLGLRSCHISDRGCAVLRSALISNPSHLRELDLSGNYFKDSGVKQFSDLLSNCRCKLLKLGLRSCDISDGGCAVLRSALILNPYHLRELDLSGNYITESGIKQISYLLEHPQCKLEKLGLKRS